MNFYMPFSLFQIRSWDHCISPFIYCFPEYEDEMQLVVKDLNFVYTVIEISSRKIWLSFWLHADALVTVMNVTNLILYIDFEIKLSNSLVLGWPWWGECSSSAYDMEDSCCRHSLWRCKGWDWLQPEGPKHKWVRTSNSGFHSKDSWSNWRSARCSCSWYGNQCSGIVLTI